MPGATVQLVNLLQSFADCYHNPNVQKALMLPVGHAIVRTLCEGGTIILHPMFALCELQTSRLKSYYNGPPVLDVKLGYKVYVTSDQPPKSEFFMLVSGQTGVSLLTADSAQQLIERMSSDDFGMIDKIKAPPIQLGEKRRPAVSFFEEAVPEKLEYEHMQYGRIDHVLTTVEHKRMLLAWSELLEAVQS
jgi:hypothetical protein